MYVSCLELLLLLHMMRDKLKWMNGDHHSAAMMQSSGTSLCRLLRCHVSLAKNKNKERECCIAKVGRGLGGLGSIYGLHNISRSFTMSWLVSAIGENLWRRLPCIPRVFSCGQSTWCACPTCLRARGAKRRLPHVGGSVNWSLGVHGTNDEIMGWCRVGFWGCCSIAQEKFVRNQVRGKVGVCKNQQATWQRSLCSQKSSSAAHVA